MKSAFKTTVTNIIKLLNWEKKTLDFIVVVVDVIVPEIHCIKIKIIKSI